MSDCITSISVAVNSVEEDLPTSIARKIKLGLEALKIRARMDVKMDKAKIYTGKKMNPDSKGIVSKDEKKALVAYTKDIKKINKEYSHKMKKLMKRKTEFGKIGTKIKGYASEAEELVLDYYKKSNGIRTTEDYSLYNIAEDVVKDKYHNEIIREKQNRANNAL